MQPERFHSKCPSIEQIIEAAKPGGSLELRASIRKRLNDCKISDDAVAGAKNFLQGCGYDFDALHDFLNKPVNLLKKNKRPAPVIKLFRVAATLAIVFVIINITRLLVQKQEPGSIVSRAVFYEPGLPSFAAISGNKYFLEMLSDYRMGDFKKGLTDYHLLSENTSVSQNDTINYFAGWLFYMNQQPDSASMCFNRAADLAGRYKSKAEFMEAVCLYLSGKKVIAKVKFKSVSNNLLNPYRHQADSLIENKILWKDQ
jgi:hypothetical protein